MNLSLQQALKYGTAEDMVRASFNTGGPKGRLFTDPVHTLVTADAVQEQGQDGMAHLLRSQAQHQQENGKTLKDLEYPYRIESERSFRSGPFRLRVGIVGPHNQDYRFLDRLKAKEEGHAVSVQLEAIHPDTADVHHTTMVLGPEEAKEATAHLPEAKHIHALIDSHFSPQAQ